MREMKDSGIEWLGEIPIHWKSMPIGALFHEIRTKNVLGNEKQALQFKMGAIVPKTNFDAEVEDYVANTITSYTLVDCGTIMINGLNLNFDFVTQRVALVKDRGAITSAYMAIKANDLNQMMPEYSTYLLKTYDNCKAFHNMGGGVRKILNFDELRRSYIIVPPLYEQKKIAEFLDAKCSEIDVLIADIQTQIETFEQYKRSTIAEAVTKGIDYNADMKDSGYEWIGKTPSTWNFIKGKYLFAQRTSKGNNINVQLLSPSQKFGVVPQTLLEELTTQNVVKVKEDTDLTAFKTIHIGDFCISLRSFQGGFEYCRYEGVVSSAYQVFYPTSEICDDYYRFLFKDKGFIEKINSYTISFRDGKNIAFSDFGNTYIPYPPIEEQKEIAKYLCDKTAEIDLCVESKKEQIATLEAYKKSIIFEYVTGKKEVV